MNEGTPPLLWGLATLLGIAALVATAYFDGRLNEQAKSISHTTTPMAMLKEDVATYPRPNYMKMSENILYFTSLKIDDLHADMESRTFINRFTKNPVSVSCGWLASIALLGSYFVEWLQKRKKAVCL